MWGISARPTQSSLLWLVFALFLATPGFAQARECDNFTNRSRLMTALPDAGPQVNQWFNERLTALLSLWNQHRVAPGPSGRQQRVRDVIKIFQTEFLRDLRSPAEDWANSSTELPRFDVPSRGIFGGAVSWEDMSNAWYLPLAGVLRYTSLDRSAPPLLIGTDKLGHFLGQGWEYYEIYRGLVGERVLPIADESALEAARQHGYQLEATSMGLISAGVFSYADLAANWSGLQFYLELIEQATTPDKPFSRRIPIEWREQRWVQTESFQVERFLFRDMDEVINPSRVISNAFWKHIQWNMRHPLGNAPSVCEAFRSYPEFFSRPVAGPWLVRSAYVSQDAIAGDRAPGIRLPIRIDLMCR